MAHNSQMFIDDSHSTRSFGRIDCLLCEKAVREREFPSIIIKALERKYCANLNNHFYTRAILRILAGERCANQLLRVPAVPRVVQLHTGGVPEALLPRA